MGDEMNEAIKWPFPTKDGVVHIAAQRPFDSRFDEPSQAESVRREKHIAEELAAFAEIRALRDLLTASVEFRDAHEGRAYEAFEKFEAAILVAVKATNARRSA